MDKVDDQAQNSYDEDTMRKAVLESSRLSDLFAAMHTTEYISQLRLVDVVDASGDYVGSICLAAGPMSEELLATAIHHMVGDTPETKH